MWTVNMSSSGSSSSSRALRYGLQLMRLDSVCNIEAQAVASEASSVFADRDLQGLIFEYVGGQQWLVMGAVCKQWQLLYVQIILSCHSMCTAYSVVFSTVPLLQMAYNSGALSLDCRETQFNAGRHGSAATLEAAHTLGMPWSKAVVQGAVRSGCVSQLEWVRAQRCMQLPAGAAELAAASGSVPMLRLLQQKGVTFTSSTSCQAAASGHLGALQFLYNKDCVPGTRFVLLLSAGTSLC
jgi:hypothetical protein